MPAESQFSFSKDRMVAFTPTWTSTGTAPSIGNGTLSGYYKLDVDLLTVVIRMLLGSTSSIGTGTYSWGLPSEIPTLMYPTQGSGWAYDSSATFVYGGIVRYNGPTSIAVLGTANPGTFYANNSPFTWAQSDDLGISFSCRVLI